MQHLCDTYLLRWFLWQLLNGNPVKTLFSLVLRHLVRRFLTVAAVIVVVDFLVVFVGRWRCRWRRRRGRWKIWWGKWGVDCWDRGRRTALEFALKNFDKVMRYTICISDFRSNLVRVVKWLFFGSLLTAKELSSFLWPVVSLTISNKSLKPDTSHTKFGVQSYKTFRRLFRRLA